ncbi:hypothetical protein FHX75_121567 [Micromonospora palomenae]|uniref:DUF11 domain-containing protein n=1 Tax=Micromonospora palomenae TaxID=1461247 RepID=A0A561WGR1_9ACTN|nr:DUF11 domain-containing protein [Micromonospora palomenae]TWG23021.1 hypothetical protein FHX75_121567 [Micromonospora palomenae]
MKSIRTRRRLAFAAASTLGLGAVLTGHVTPATAAPKRADLSVTVSAVQPGVPTQGSWRDFTIDLRNVGTATADGVAVSISRPAGTVWGGWGESTSPPGWDCAVGDADWICRRGPLAAGAVADELPLWLSLPAGEAGSTAVVGAVATTTSAEPVLDNNSDEVALPYVEPDLAVALTPDRAGAAVGEQVTYQVGAVNNGPDAEYMKVNIYVPTGMTPVDVFYWQDWDCNLGRDLQLNQDVWSCYTGLMPAGASASELALTMRVDQAVPGDVLTAIARIEGRNGLDMVTENNSAAAPVTVVEAPAVG